jgi:hypothetical protein
VPVPLGVVITVALAIGLAHYFANRALYYPLKFPVGDWDPQRLVGASDAWIETADGVKIHGWWAERPGSPWATLFLHGNAGNITNRVARASRNSSPLDHRS